MMAANGMATMLKALGLDPDELKANVETFMSGMKAQADAINANQIRLEAKLDNLTTLMLELMGPRPQTREIYENGERTGVLITDERFPQALIDDVNVGDWERASNDRRGGS